MKRTKKTILFCGKYSGHPARPKFRFARIAGALATLFLLLPGSIQPMPAGEWSVLGALQLSRGNYTFDQSTTTYYFYGGLRYKTPRWNVSLSVPVVGQNTDLITRAGGMFYPSGEAHHGAEGNSRMGDGGMMRGTSMEGHNFIMDFGDMYFYGEYQLAWEKHGLPSISVNSQVKIPTASSENNFGTGQWDYSLGVSLRKAFASYLFFLDAGYLMIGDPPGITYNDPVFWGFGVGKFLQTNRLSVLLYYQNYSTISTGFEAPRQLSLGLFNKLPSNVMLSLSLGIGLSQTSPDVTLYGGMELPI